jgi:hypothetical protein
MYGTNCLMPTNYVIPVITWPITATVQALCRISLCFLKRKQDTFFQRTQFFLLINKFLMFTSATCFVFYTKAVFSRNYYYIGRSRLWTATTINHTGSDMWYRIFFNTRYGNETNNRCTQMYKRNLYYKHSASAMCFGNSWGHPQGGAYRSWISGFHRALLQSITFIVRLMHSII